MVDSGSFDWILCQGFSFPCLRVYREWKLKWTFASLRWDWAHFEDIICWVPISTFHRFSDKEPLPWSTRVQIALDSARGLEYIHEHTVPVYIHRDIKSANILIDKNFHGKVIPCWILHQDGPFSSWTNKVVYDRWQILVWQSWLRSEAHLSPHDL